MDKRQALNFWFQEYGDQAYAYDFVGRKIERSEYMEESATGWVVTYLRPLAQAGPADDTNAVIFHYLTEAEKGDNYPEFTANEMPYRVAYQGQDGYYFLERCGVDPD